MLKEYLTDEKYEELKMSNNSIYKALELSLILFKNALGKFKYKSFPSSKFPTVYFPLATGPSKTPIV